MSPLLRFLPVAVLAFTAPACRASQPDAPTEPAAPSGAALDSTPSGTSPSDRSPSEAAGSSPEGVAAPSGVASDNEAARPDVPPEVLARWLTDAAQRDESAVLQHALVELGRGLASYRTAWTPELLVALRVVTVPSVAATLQRIDARFLPPLLEGLLDGRDYAGILRATEGREHGPATALLVPMRRHVEGLANVAGTLSETGCGDEPWRNEVIGGTWEVRCGDLLVNVFVVPGETTVVTWLSDDVLVDPPDMRLPAPAPPAPRDEAERDLPLPPPRWL